MVLKEIPRRIRPRQPGADGGFLMRATTRAAAQQATEAGETDLEPGQRPPLLDLVSQRLQPPPPRPATDDQRHAWVRARRRGGEERAPRGHDAVLQSPGDEESPHRRFDGAAGRPPELMAPQARCPPLAHQGHVPPRPLPPPHVAQAPVGRQGGRHEDPSGAGHRRR